MAQKHLLTKTPRAVLYGLALAGAVVFAIAVWAEMSNPGAVQRVAEAADTVAVQVGAIIATLAILAGPVLSLLNLSDDEPKPPITSERQG